MILLQLQDAAGAGAAGSTERMRLARLAEPHAGAGALRVQCHVLLFGAAPPCRGVGMRWRLVCMFLTIARASSPGMDSCIPRPCPDCVAELTGC